MIPSFFESILELVTVTATDLPWDVRSAMGLASQHESAGSQASQALKIIALNVDQAVQDEGPICQDTGMPTFEIKVPVGHNQIWMRQQIRQAVVEATRRGKLRPNSVDSIAGTNSGDNLGPGTPIIHFEQWERDDIEVRLILKGGGCENTNIQYSLPAELPHVGRADRSLDGVRRCILHAVWQAQGKGCSPGAIGVCIGGDRTSGYLHAKEQLFRELEDRNPDSRLAELEAAIMSTANDLGVGAMGFGGQVSLIGCKIGALNRLPASFFVSVAYNCWAFRRLGVVLDGETGEIRQWLYRDPAARPADMAAALGLDTTHGMPATGREVRLTAPIDEAAIRSLQVGDMVLISGRMYTGRDAVHAHLMKHEPPVDLRGHVIYHCGPVVLKDGDGWRMTAAGPTTSSREEPYQAEILSRYGVRVVIGKGGMGARTLAALKDAGGVYLNAVGGAAQYYARCIERVDGVSFPEFGTPEAMWHLWVRDFPALVTMDAHGNSLHKDVEDASALRLAAVAR